MQVETLQKSLKSTSLGSMGGSTGSISGNDPQNVYLSPSVQNQLVQVKELEEEVSYICYRFWWYKKNYLDLLFLIYHLSNKIISINR